jgi:hypothetical protein
MLALAAVAFAATAFAQDDYGHGRVRYVEPGVVLQSGSETGSEEAQINAPLVAGDRVFTDERGRAEFQFDDGTILRLDSQSKLDFIGRDERRGGLALRLWSGGVYVHTSHDADGLVIETPGGIVEAQTRGVYRIDTEAGETRLSVYEGEASLDSGRRRERVEAGERSYTRRGEIPEPARRFDVNDDDDFARFDADRDERVSYASDGRRYLPDEVAPYAAELDSSGSWYYETEVGYVWRPYVGAGWRPYSDGRWVWTSYGWTWIPSESWGWAPFHYGRWGWTAALGWYWIPGNTWGPAWVSWAVGNDYVGWCPLGHRNRPVIVHDRNRGFAKPRGTVTVDASESRAWVFTRRGDMAARDLARRRVDVRPDDIRLLKMMDSTQLRPARDLRTAVDAHAAVRTKPTMGDFVPELRSAPLSTIPSHLAGQPRHDGFGGIESRDGLHDAGAAARERTPRDGSAHPTDVRTLNRYRDESRPAAHPTDQRGRERAPADAPTGARAIDRYRDNDRPPGTRDSDRSRSPERPRDTSSAHDAARTREAERPRERETQTQERDVLRRFFQPTEPRNEGNRAAPRDEPRERQYRSEPRRNDPPPQAQRPRNDPPPQQQPAPRPHGASDGAKPREKDKP